MQIHENYPLKNLNTFGIAANARHYVDIRSMEELHELIDSDIFKNSERLILGGGSNMLFMGDVQKLVIDITIPGKKVLKETDEFVEIEVGAGENWHEFVQYCVEHDYRGVENLALIPGTVGAAPIQNIGAYGCELKETVECVRGIEISTNTFKEFCNLDCDFGYRTSVFKKKMKNDFIITSVVFKLFKKKEPNASYKDVSQELEKMGITQPKTKDIFDAVVSVRTRKLPDPKVTGNAGSFFKNPYIPKEQYEALKAEYPEIPGYPIDNEQIKVPAAWLIEQCGWKGKRFGDAGVHPNQALVIVNYGNATGKELVDLSKKIQSSVAEKFGIELEPEVWVI
jgi:UDP-N-acetylmuramate dehydrogenase